LIARPILNHDRLQKRENETKNLLRAPWEIFMVLKLAKTLNNLSN
jgi:hypothetical protein